MASSNKVTDKGLRRRAIRRQHPRVRKLTEADEHHVLEPVASPDALHQPAALAETHLPLIARQTLAQNIAQRQGNAPLQRLLSTVQRQQTTVQRKTKTKPAITTPVGKEAKQLKSGAAQLTINGVIVTILPDKVSKEKKLAGQAETKCDIDWGRIPGYTSRDDVVIKLKNKLPTPRITIQTTYGPGAKAADSSAYGRGTTEEDKEADNTSLGFHEGQHGLNFLQYLRENPLPKVMGAVGMKVTDYEAAKSAYEQATQAYSTAMGEQSKAQTDCVGNKASLCVIE